MRGDGLVSLQPASSSHYLKAPDSKHTPTDSVNVSSPFHSAHTRKKLAVLVTKETVPDLPAYYSQHLDRYVKAMLKLKVQFILR